MKKQKTKTYADYLKQGNNINPGRLAPISAHAKHGPGWGPGQVFKEATIRSKSGIDIKDLEIPKRGYLIRRKPDAQTNND